MKRKTGVSVNFDTSKQFRYQPLNVTVKETDFLDKPSFS